MNIVNREYNNLIFVKFNLKFLEFSRFVIFYTLLSNIKFNVLILYYLKFLYKYHRYDYKLFQKKFFNRRILCSILF